MNLDWQLTRCFWTVFNNRILSPLKLPSNCCDITSLIYDGGKKLIPELLANPSDPKDTGPDCTKLCEYVTGLCDTILGIEKKQSALFILYSNLIESFCHIHVANANVWDNEDPCREYMGKDNSCDLIPHHKRCIDVANQRRNDFVEECDKEYYDDLAEFMRQSNIKWKSEPRYASEGIGSLLDRLSINTLKLYHTALLINAKNRTSEQQNKLVSKLGALMNQSAYLAKQCDDLIAEMMQGNTLFIKFKQYKLYNSPETNPYYRTT